MTELHKDIVLSNNDMHPAEEIAHLKDLLGKANTLARIRAERIKELEAQAGVEPVVVPEDVIAGALYDFLGYLTSRRTRITMSDRDDAGAAVDALVDWSKTRKIRLEDACVKNWEKYTHPPARVPLNDEQMDAVIEAAHHSLRQYKYSIRGQQITQFDSIEAHVIRETERAHDIKE